MKRTSGQADERTSGSARGAVLVGIDRVPVTVTAELLILTLDGGGAPSLDVRISGLPEASAREARVRIRSALSELPARTVAVAVEGFPLGGASASPLDLAIAAAVLRALGREVMFSADTVFVGEVGLTGKVSPVRGGGALVSADGTPHVLARNDAPGVSRVVSVVDHVLDVLSPPVPRSPAALLSAPSRGRDELTASQASVLDRCLELRRVMLVGPPGSGKVMIARRAASAAPPLTDEERGEVVRIYSAAGISPPFPPERTGGSTVSRPFRAPHHTVSEAGLVGGGTACRPGEATLAHHGVLYLDEATELRRSAVQALGRVLRDGESILRASSDRFARLPARPFAVVASATACPCGGAVCRCSPLARARHEERIAFVEEALGLTRVGIGAATLAEIAARGTTP